MLTWEGQTTASVAPVALHSHIHALGLTYYHDRHGDICKTSMSIFFTNSHGRTDADAWVRRAMGGVDCGYQFTMSSLIANLLINIGALLQYIMHNHT